MAFILRLIARRWKYQQRPRHHAAFQQVGGVFKFKGHKYMNYFEMFIQCPETCIALFLSPSLLTPFLLISCLFLSTSSPLPFAVHSHQSPWLDVALPPSQPRGPEQPVALPSVPFHGHQQGQGGAFRSLRKEQVSGGKNVLFQKSGFRVQEDFIENLKEIDECPLSFPVGGSFCFCFMFFCCDNEGLTWEQQEHETWTFYKSTNLCVIYN